MSEQEKEIAEDILTKVKAANGVDERIQLIHAYNILMEAIMRRLQIEKGI
ncbi:hypothetical protein KAR91_44955 [Candidatus Pacearchaeota archaeon]|nr:hypothetical protein [Candidatus Pacearchaeota archaeon]